MKESRMLMGEIKTGIFQLLNLSWTKHLIFTVVEYYNFYSRSMYLRNTTSQNYIYTVKRV